MKQGIRSTARGLLLAGLLACLSGTPWAQPAVQALTPHQQLGRDILKELVEINTVTNIGDTLRAAEAMAARLRAGGFAAADVQVLSSAPRKGNLVARLRGSGARRPILLLAHLDTVSAAASDWSADPFTFVERDGYFHGRGVADTKYLVAVWVSNLIRYRQEGYRPERDIVVVLETDEETLDANQHGIRWLLQHHRVSIDAEFALNEGAGLRVAHGKPVFIALQASEKVSQNYRLEVRNPGGHSSRPTKENAIYRLADGLARLARFDFPLELNETTRRYFERTAALVEDAQEAADMRAILGAHPEPAAVERLSSVAQYNAIMRTTCVATRLDAGLAANVLPTHAAATVNCRILPGTEPAEVRSVLQRVLADEQISVTRLEGGVPSPASPLTPELLATIERVSQSIWPGIPLVPTMLAGATDGSYLRNAGIPTYGHTGLGLEAADGARIHGRDERIPVRAMLEGQEYLYRLVKALAGGP